MDLNSLNNTNCFDCLIEGKITYSKRLSITESRLHEQYFIRLISNVIKLVTDNNNKDKDVSSKNILSLMPNQNSKCPWLTKDIFAISIEKMPPCIRTLWSLVYLELGPNDMSELLNKTCNLNKLPILLVESHYLTQLPNNIGNLISFKVLKLNQDQLTRLPDFVKYLQEFNFLDLHKNNIHNILKSLYKLVMPKRIDPHGNFYNAMHILIKNMPCKNRRNNVYDPTIMKYSNVKNDKSKFNNNYYKCAKKTSMETEFSSLSSPCDETENWDISDDSTDEYDPNVCKEPRMKRVYVPFGIYGPPGGRFCPGDSHPPSIREQLYQIKYQQNSTADCYHKSEEGQFDDA